MSRILPSTLLLALQICLPAVLIARDQAPEANSSPLSLQLALEKLNAGDTKGAILDFEALDRASALPLEGKVLLGALYIDTGRAASAIPVLEPLSVGDDADPRVLFELGRAYLALGRASEAEVSLKRAVDRAPYSRAALLLADLGEQKGVYSEVAQLLEPLATGEAIERIEKRDPALATEIAFRYAKALIVLDQEETAVEHLQRVTRLSPSNVEAWQLLGQALTEVDRLDEAYEALAQVQAIEESERTKALGDAERAKQLIKKATELRDQERREESLSALEEAVRLAPQNPLPRILEVRLLIEMKRDQQALDRAENLVRITGGAAEALHLRGMSKLGLSDLEGAEEDFRAALERDSEHRAALNALALTLMSRGKLAEARQILATVIELYPDDAVAAKNLEELRNQR